MADPFKAYDIRGKVPGQLNPELAYKIGKAIALHFNPEKVVVGFDKRASSESIFKELVKALNESGTDVDSIGLTNTPMVRNIAINEYDLGIMITASHNPKEYNGLKLTTREGFQITSKTGLEKLEQLVEENNFPAQQKNGTFHEINALDKYLNFIQKNFDGKFKNKIVADFGNGVGALTVVPFLERNSIPFSTLYEKPDPDFPNHEANPIKYETLKELQKKVLEEKAVLGAAFDGDADRIVLIDEKGKIVPSDFLVGMLAVHYLKTNPNEKVYCDLRFSRAVFEEVEKAGGIPVKMRVGNPYYKEKMLKEGGLIAGELSGHIMFKNNFAQDDDLFCLAMVFNVLSETNKPLSELIAPFRKYFQSGEINLKVEDKQKTFDFLEKEFSNGIISKIDGLLVDFPEWWFSVRASNTEPLMRLNVEANSNELLAEKRDLVLKHIQDSIL